MTDAPTSVTLVTGATGRHGGTGAHVARRLRDRKRSVRLLVRTRDERSEALEADGFEVRVGDLRDRASLLPALEGVTEATFCFPVGGGILEAATHFASAVRSASPSARVVVMSMIAAQETSPSHLGRAQWLAEEAMAWAGLDLCILRIAATFYENLLLLHGASIRREGLIRNCFGDAAVPWIAAEDAAELMVGALLDRARYSREAVHYPMGTALHSHAEVAEMLSTVLAKPVRYEPVSMEAWRSELLDLALLPGTGINADMAKHISAVGAALARRGALRAPDAIELERLLGRPALSLPAFLRARAAQFQF